MKTCVLPFLTLSLVALHLGKCPFYLQNTFTLQLASSFSALHQARRLNPVRAK